MCTTDAGIIIISYVCIINTVISNLADQPQVHISISNINIGSTLGIGNVIGT